MRSLFSRRELFWLATAVGASEHDSGLLDHYLHELDAADERRRRRLAAIESKRDVLALQDRVRRMMQGALGPFPERSPLEARTTGELGRGDYTIEKILFQSQPGYYVSGNVYRPSANGRRPAVVQSCGHYEEGKAKDDYQLACIGLAKRGFVVLIFDPLGQGERLMFRKPGEKRAGSEHPIAGKPMLLLGRTLANARMWDIMRAFDYLETRPDVDKTRMGLLGHSGGGMMTILTSPLEPRIRAAMSCCAVTTFYHKTRSLKTSDPEQIVPGVFAEGVDHPEMIAAVAPRAFLIGAVLHETSVPLEGTRRTYEDARRIYDIMGASDRFAKVESDDVHKLDRNLREACYGWMLKHLANDTSGNTVESETKTETPEDLWCTKNGRVMDLEKARSIFDLNVSYARDLERRGSGRVTAAAVKALLPAPADDAFDVPTTMTKGRGEALIVLVSEKGRNSAYAKEVSSLFADAGYPVLGADLRGWGETMPTRTPANKRSNWEDYCAWTSVELGRPLLAMRVADLLGAVRKASGEYKKVYVAGLEGAGLVALHAAAIDPSIAGVAVNRTLVSYQDVLDRPVTAEPVASFVWSALTRYDLPDLAKAIAPRACAAVDPFHAMRRPVSGSDAMPAREAVRAMLQGLRL